MRQHTYHDFHYAVLHCVDWVTSSGHRIHERFETIEYADIVWC